MPNEMEIMAYIDRRVMIPDPGERFIQQNIHSEIISSIGPLVADPGFNDRKIQSEIISSITTKPALSQIGQWADIRIFTDAIDVGVTSAVA